MQTPFRVLGLHGQYDPPEDYSVPNPLGPRVHNWKGGRLNEGSLYHGPVYTRPSYNLNWTKRPLFGVDQPQADMLGVVLPVLVLGGFVAVLFWPTGGRK